MITLTEDQEFKLPSTIHDLAVDPDGASLWAACLDGGIYRVNLADGKAEPIGHHQRYASGVHVLEKQDAILSAGYDGRLLWHDRSEAKVFREVKAHDFWSWQSALSPDQTLIATVTGQYQCGGYKYEPAPEREPSVKVFDTKTGDLIQHFPHVPPVESVAFSRDGRFLAAGNLMGEVRVWNLSTGDMTAQWTTPSFTGWGIIKGHYYTGGIFSLTFGPQNDDLYLAGMGSTRDPAAGNGKQLWEHFSWKAGEPDKVSSASNDDIGSGLMESLTFHPSDAWFVMAGRLESGQWNAAAFDTSTGTKIADLNLKARFCRAAFSSIGDVLYLAGGVSQDKDPASESPKPFGRLHIVRIVQST